MTTREMKVGQFAERNKSILYRFQLIKSFEFHHWLSGIYTVFRHPSIPMWKTLNDNGNYVWELSDEDVTLITNPEKRHIDNTIKMLKEDLNNNMIDNLTYVENLSILKNYLKSVIIVDEEKK